MLKAIKFYSAKIILLRIVTALWEKKKRKSKQANKQNNGQFAVSNSWRVTLTDSGQ